MGRAVWDLFVRGVPQGWLESDPSHRENLSVSFSPIYLFFPDMGPWHGGKLGHVILYWLCFSSSTQEGSRALVEPLTALWHRGTTPVVLDRNVSK